MKRQRFADTGRERVLVSDACIGLEYMKKRGEIGE